MQFMVQRDAAAQRQRQRHRMDSDFGGAVIRDVADEDVAACRRLAVELVVAEPMRSALEFLLGLRAANFEVGLSTTAEACTFIEPQRRFPL